MADFDYLCNEVLKVYEKRHFFCCNISHLFLKNKYLSQVALPLFNIFLLYFFVVNNLFFPAGKYNKTLVIK